MTDGKQTTADRNSTIRAVLEGGATDIPEAVRMCSVPATDLKVKLAHNGGYEHFERQDAADGNADGATVFQWTARTKVAE